MNYLENTVVQYPKPYRPHDPRQAFTKSGPLSARTKFRKIRHALWEEVSRSNLQRMGNAHTYNISVEDVAHHYDLKPRTVRDHLKSGNLHGVRIKGKWRCSWPDIFTAEKGPMPRGERAALYKAQLLTKKALAAKWGVSERTVERWIEMGLPTRNVFGSVRIAPVDADEWMQRIFGAAENAA